MSPCANRFCKISILDSRALKEGISSLPHSDPRACVLVGSGLSRLDRLWLSPVNLVPVIHYLLDYDIEQSTILCLWPQNVTLERKRSNVSSGVCATETKSRPICEDSCLVGKGGVACVHLGRDNTVILSAGREHHENCRRLNGLSVSHYRDQP